MSTDGFFIGKLSGFELRVKQIAVGLQLEASRRWQAPASSSDPLLVGGFSSLAVKLTAWGP